MTALICGSFAFDSIMVFPGRFRDHILPDRIHMLNVSFLVPTLRRATRERSNRAGIPVEFESMGQDRRLPMDLESALFRMLDEALAGYLGVGPEHDDHLAAP